MPPRSRPSHCRETVEQGSSAAVAVLAPVLSTQGVIVARIPKAEIAERRAMQRRAAMEGQRRKRSTKRVVAAALVVGMAVLVVVASPPTPGVAYPSLGNVHLAHPGQAHAPYNSTPASSGPHVGALANWGEADRPLAPELYVHNLEDGGVVLAYACSDCEELVGRLRDVVRDHTGARLVLTRVDAVTDPAGVGHRAAAVAWGRVLFLDDLGAEEMSGVEQFISLFEGVDHHVRTGGHN